VIRVERAATARHDRHEKAREAPRNSFHHGTALRSATVLAKQESISSIIRSFADRVPRMIVATYKGIVYVDTNFPASMPS
jgi:hypothetical protein